MLNRSRRLRTSLAMRNLVAETDLRPRHLIQPHFVQPMAGSTEISSMPGIFNASVEDTFYNLITNLYFVNFYSFFQSILGYIAH